MNKKPFWMKLIIGILIFMITISSILPTNVVLADDPQPVDPEEDIVVIDDDSASFFESLICKLLMMLGTGAYVLVCLAIGDNFSIEKVIFNDYANTKLAFFENDIPTIGENNFIKDNKIRETLNDFFSFFRGIAFVAYLVILVYIGIRILLGTTAEKGSRHKELLVYWMQGILILFLFPYVMKYAIHINNAFVGFVGANKDQFIKIEAPQASAENNNLTAVGSLIDKFTEDLQKGSDFMSYMYKQAMERGWLVYAICWFIMFFQMIGFLVVYFKRVLILMFLIAIFPLVMISYAIDKVGDGKSQAFGSWVKEYTLNVFIQSFHAIAYVLIMSIVSSLGSDPKEYWLVMLIGLSFISKGDDILRGIFSLSGTADTVKGIGKSVKDAVAVTAIAGNAKKMGNRLFGKGSHVQKFGSVLSEYNNKRWEGRENRAEKESTRLDLEQLEAENKDDFLNNPNINLNEMTDDELRNDIDSAMQTILNKENVTDDEFRNAVDKLTGYRNQTENERVQNILTELSQNLTPEQAKMLEDILKQNAAINAVLVGGREINFKQNVDLILTMLTRDKDGNLTPESLALLKKIANSEEDAKTIMMLGDVKFNKEKVKAREEKKEAARAQNNPYWQERESRILRGRGAAVANRGRVPNARNAAEAAMMLQSMGSTQSNAKATSSSKNSAGSFAPGSNRVLTQQNGKTAQTATSTANAKTGNVGTTSSTTSTRSSRGDAQRNIPKRKTDAERAREKRINQMTQESGGLTKKKKAFENVVDSSGNSASGQGGGVVAGKVYKTSSSNSKKHSFSAATSSKPSRSMSTADRMVRYSSGSSSASQGTSSSSVGSNFGVPESRAISSSGKQEKLTVREAKERKEAILQEAKENKKHAARESRERGRRFTIKRVDPSEYIKNANSNVQNSATPANVGGSSSRSSTPVSSSRYNPGAALANTQGTAESLQSALDGITETKPQRENVRFSDREQRKGGKIYDEVISTSSSRALVENLPEMKEDMVSLASSIAVLSESGSGEHTAEKLLKNIKNIREISETYNGTSEAGLIEDIVSKLGYNLDDYESLVRVKVLNDPDSVANNSHIIKECKEYVQNTEMSDIIRSRLNYDIEDLSGNTNLKYLHPNGADSKGAYVSNEATEAQAKFENAMKRYELEKKMAKLDYDYEKIKNDEKKDLLKAGGEAFLATIDTGLVGMLDVSAGLVATGMSVDGKKDAIFDAPGKFLTGMSAFDGMYGTVTGNVKGFYEDNLKREKKEKKREKFSYEPFTAQDLEARINNLRDKTEVKGESFVERRMSGNGNNNI